MNWPAAVAAIGVAASIAAAVWGAAWGMVRVMQIPDPEEEKDTSIVPIKDPS